MFVFVAALTLISAFALRDALEKKNIHATCGLSILCSGQAVALVSFLYFIFDENLKLKQFKKQLERLELAEEIKQL